MTSRRVSLPTNRCIDGQQTRLIHRAKDVCADHPYSDLIHDVLTDFVPIVEIAFGFPHSRDCGPEIAIGHPYLGHDRVEVVGERWLHQQVVIRYVDHDQLREIVPPQLSVDFRHRPRDDSNTPKAPQEVWLA